MNEEYASADHDGDSVRRDSLVEDASSKVSWEFSGRCGVCRSV